MILSSSPVRDDARLLRQFRLALQSGAIVPHYQPEVDFDRPDWMGFEALSRWRNPESADISPAVFIPLAERHGLLAELTMRQINHLALDAPLLTQRFDQVALGFNLSATLLGHGGIQDALARAVGVCRDLPLTWEVEITETEPIVDFGATRAQLNHWRELGVKIVLDDFGTGWSNWVRAELLPVDRIKIDSGFVRDLPSASVQSVLREIRARALAQDIELTVEGVETAEQENRLRALGFTRFQGWLYAQAMPLTEVLASSGFLKHRL